MVQRPKSKININSQLLCYPVMNHSTPATRVQYNMDKATETKNEFLSATYELQMHKLCLWKICIPHWNTDIYSCFHNQVTVTTKARHKIMIYIVRYKDCVWKSSSSFPAILFLPLFPFYWVINILQPLLSFWFLASNSSFLVVFQFMTQPSCSGSFSRPASFKF
jgi:hypothetical protein